MTEVEYTYGTSSAAASRLEDIGEYFNPLAADFIRPFIPGVPEIAADLGCGPGFTTDMLAKTTQCPRTYGLDSSPAFLEMAKQRFSHCTFLAHDITRVPFPVIPNVMYARFLLCHLEDPLNVVAAWTTQLAPDGVLFIEEIDAIETELEVFKTYLATGEGIIATQGASLYVGNALASAKHEATVLLNESVALPVPDWQAASWFYPNTQTIWNDNAYVRDRLTPGERKSIADELERLKTSKNAHSHITWKMRRLVLREGAA